MSSHAGHPYYRSSKLQKDLGNCPLGDVDLTTLIQNLCVNNKTNKFITVELSYMGVAGDRQRERERERQRSTKPVNDYILLFGQLVLKGR